MPDASPLARPGRDELPEYHARYVALVPDGDLLTQLRRTGEATAAALATLGDAGAAHRYAADKWSVKQVLGHLIDGERVFGFRALSFARGEAAVLPDMDQEAWMRLAGFDARPLERLVAEFRAVRAATLLQFGSFDAAAARRRGRASTFEFSARSLGWIVAGHELHHRAILRERYGVALPEA
ncbi:MAG: DinB family protein [Planctomycetota bacterium]